MNDVEAFAALLAALIASLSVIGGAVIWLVQPRVKAFVLAQVQPIREQQDEIHRMTTQNGHSSGEPATLRDDMADLKRGQSKTREDLLQLASAVFRTQAAVEKQTLASERIERRLAEGDERFDGLDEAIRRIDETTRHYHPEEDR